MKPAARCTTALICLPLSFSAAAEEINVAVAANFLGTLQALAPQFERASGHELVLSSGSSGQFYAQIRQGAPFDVFLCADAERPRLLESEGLTVPGSRFTYAIGTLVLWSPDAAVVDDAGKVLQRGRYKFIGLANPRNAPYGAAAREVLTALGLWEKLEREKKIVLGESITQAWQFAASHNVELAFVSLSQVTAANGTISGSHWLPPQSMYTRIDQDAVVLARTTKRGATEAFTSWLRVAPEARAVIRAAGYRIGD